MQSGFDISAKKEIRRTAEVPVRPTYYASLGEVSHHVYWPDGHRVFIQNGALFDEYLFHRTSRIDPAGGEWLLTGVTTDPPVDW